MPTTLTESNKKKDAVIEENAERYFSGVGRRKRATATVRIFHTPAEKDESGASVNGRPLADYFPTLRLQSLSLAPAKAIGVQNELRISAHVRGGGLNGQAAAVSLGLARAIVAWNTDHRPVLKSGKLLSRDARKVERKKAGLKKARRAPQWSKR